MLPSETIASGASNVCCGKTLKNEVCQSAAGYYIGTKCHYCGPYSRESDYYKTYEAAEAALKFGNFER